MSQLCDLLRTSGFCARAGCPLRHAPACNICNGVRIVEDPRVHYLSKKHLRAAYNKGVTANGWCHICSVYFPANSYGFAEHFAGKKHAKTADSKGKTPYPKLETNALRQCFACNRLIQNRQWSSHVQGQAHHSKAAKRDIALPGFLVPDLAPSPSVRNVNLGNVDPQAKPRTFTVPFTFSRSAVVLNVQLSDTNAGLSSQNP